ncbi:class I SAM-dependent RNA methyltransferase [Oceanibacterium hippocampi]|uniref:23S rRNA (Uracil(1939)-C(5))-methyltransferase RlmD n=1 Tax=Oceanibacterium hippocampi TaxID=745714 RepID=A0A1Y5TXY5_9PROT|nr:class I SAM-dependent RNA methyltransferase [Oceanibacterium hippocampi]SLN72978.1 23S rRNA (uracil(1939)-C(5))-methyltransferase RlmD [Oceanibacterium hippocampi]
MTELVISGIGQGGDGLAEQDGGRWFVPFAAPGDRVIVRPGARRGGGHEGLVERLVTPGPHRVEPACRHFGNCGGCALQHVDGETYRALKRQWLTDALGHRGLDAPALEEAAASEPGTRRRTAFSAFRHARGVALGYHRRRGHHVVDIDECPVLDPALVALAQPLRALLETLLRPGGTARIEVSRLDNGTEMVLALPYAPDLAAREKLAGFAEAQDIARVALADREGGPAEIALLRRPPEIRFDGIPVIVPPGTFLQATGASEAVLSRFAVESLAGSRMIADLFSGLGTFSLPLAREARVHAVETDQAALRALAQAAGGASRPVTTEARDLFRRPLMPAELKRFDGVLFDPPRAGAEAQARMLAESSVDRVVAVSCNPGTFARDLRLLADGGYRIERLLLVDQFLWSPHLEAAALLRRG